MSDLADDLRAVMENPQNDNQEVIDKDPATGDPLLREENPFSDKARDESGRFAPKTAAENKVPADKEQGKETPEALTAPEEGKPEDPAAGQPPPQQATAPRAPVSWKPEVREEWAKLPASVQQEVLRRENEVQAVMRTSAQTRQFYQQFEQTVAPYEAILRAENAHPLTAIGELFKTAAALRTSPAPQRASLVADMIFQFGIDPSLLDEALAERVTSGRKFGQPQVAPEISALEQKLNPVIDFVNQMRAQPVARMQTEVQQEWEAFAADPKNEFANDVAQEMADLLDLATRRGQILSLQDAYNRATMAHPTIAGLVQQRRAQSAAAQQTAAARRAREAAASISNGNAPPRADESAGDGSLRSDILSAAASLNRR